MGHQLLIIGCTGSLNPKLMTELTALLGTKGLEIRHASTTYQGQTEYAIGTPQDLHGELKAAYLPVTAVTQAAPKPIESEVAVKNDSVVTLDTLDRKLNRLLDLATPPKPSRPSRAKGAEKKEGGAGDCLLS